MSPPAKFLLFVGRGGEEGRAQGGEVDGDGDGGGRGTKISIIGHEYTLGHDTGDSR